MRMRFVGGNRAPRITGSQQLPGKVNYFIGNDPKQWRSDLPTYAQVRYEDMYPGVSVVYYGTPGRLEYDLLLDPRVDPTVITLDFSGVNQERIDSQGNLRLLIAGGEVLLAKPRIYQNTVGGGQESIAGGYLLKPGNRVGLQVGEYDRSRPLIVDPVLTYSTYLGGSGYDAGTAIAVDALANTYVTGFTRSTNFPVTAGALDTACGTSGTCNGYFWDAFVTKLNPSGQLVYSTYLGGSATDAGKAIAVDTSGSAYIAGQTFSSDFPTTAGAFQTTYAGAGDTFVAKVSPAGTSLQYSTYLGGSGTDNAEGIAVDVSGNAYVTGQTYSTDFPTAAAIQVSNGGSQDSDAFVTEINSSGSALVYSTYLGGSSMDWGNAIAVDASGDAYIAGFTRSTDFPVAAPLQVACGGCPGFADVFLAELGPNGGALLHSTYLGGSGDDHGTGITIDPAGNIYVTGFTYSTDFPVTLGAYQASLPSGTSAAFVTKIAPGFSSVIFSTYVHGTNLNYGKSIAVDTGNVFVAGQTYSPTFPLVSPIQSTCVPSNCFFGVGFITELNASGSGLIFSTYLGGSHGDDIAGMALDPSANIQVTGQAASTDFPVANAFQTTFGGSFGDAFIAKISLDPAASLSPTSLTFGSQNIGTPSAPQTVTLSSNGTGPLHITSVVVSGDFAETDNCGKGVAAGSTCAINVTFTPTASGTRTGTLTINDNSSSSSQTVTLTGSAAANAPVVNLSPSSLSFGNQALGVTSAPQNVTLTNTGSASLSITGIAMGGTNPGDFAQTNDCGTSVAIGASCTFTVTFTPPVIGSRSATIDITDNASGSPQHVSLTGTGVGPMVTLNPTSLSFGNQSVGTTSGAKTIQLKNTGNATLNISSIAFTGTNATDFAQTNNCPNSLAPGAQCNINLTFAPTNFGTLTASLSISDDALNSPQTASLTGSGTSGPTNVTVTPNNLSFGNQPLGASSVPQTVALKNTGGSPLSITGIAITGPNPGDFSQTNDCGTSVAVGGSCTFSVTFTPTASGNRSATLSITDNAGGSPQHVNLTGNGTGAMATLNPTSLSFGNQNVGTTSGPKTIQLKSTGNATLNISSIAITGTNGADFAQTNNCPSSLAPGAQCNIKVTFAPTNFGTLTASLSISDDALNSPQTASLTGSGTSGPTNVTLTPNNLSFGNQSIGPTSAPQTSVLKNTGNSILVISSIAIAGPNPGDFAQTNNCGTTVAVGASCTFNVTFTPTASGNRSATLNITDNAGGSPQHVNLTGSGTGLTATLNPTSLSFDNQNVGTTSGAKTIQLKNAGNITLTVSSIAVAGTNATDFAQTNNCPSSLAPGAQCNINLTFSPTGPGTRNGSLTVTDNANSSPQAASLAGTGVGPAATLSPSSLTFSSQVTATTSAPQAVTLTNTGNATLTMSNFAITGANAGDFAQTNNCGNVVGAGLSCTIKVTFTPSATGTRTASLSVADNAGGTPQTVSLSGTGGAPPAPATSLSPTSVTFAGQQVGTTSTAQTVTLSNTGNAALSITSITITGTNAADFSETNNCGSSLAAGSSCSIAVSFTPAASGTRTASLSVSDNASGSPQTASLSGTGLAPAPAASLSPTGINFGNQTVLMTSAPQSITLTNSGNAPLAINSITIAGTNAADFAQTNNCGASLAAGTSCTINVTFTPSSLSTESASLDVSDNAAGSPQSASLTGTGSLI